LGQSYKGHLAARDAFIAGNDLLYLSNVQSADDPDETTTIRSTLAFFAQKYREDTVFSQRVDEAVLRILKMKLRLYDNLFFFEGVRSSEGELEEVGRRTDLAVEIARNSATLISPVNIESENQLGAAPTISERIVFITDSRAFRQCSTCQMQLGMDVRALHDAVLRLYGPRAAGQIGDWNLFTYSMADLANYLGDPIAAPLEIALSPQEEFEENLLAADWLIFSILRSSPEQYGSGALRLLLDRRPELVFDKRVVAFAHDVPYELDATEISKLDQYYALYSQAEPFVEYAARLLFREVTATGNSPVSIPGIGYDLIQVTSPDSEQIIHLSVNKEGATEGEEAQDIYSTGDIVTIQTASVLDANGHRVPDGTPVDFILDYQGENLPSFRISATTVMGVAEVSVSIDRPGTLVIRAESPPARNSDLLQLSVQGEITEGGTPLAAVETGTQPPSPTETPIPTAEPTPSTPEDGTGAGDLEGGFGFGDLMLGLFGVGVTGSAAYLLGSLQFRKHHLKLRLAVIAAIGSLVGYNYLVLNLPGSAMIYSELGIAATLLVALMGGIIAAGVSMLLAPRK
jgi:beta-N-acetylhexosaminidase